MFAQRFALAAAALALSAGASAQVGITADLGTTGVGAHLVIPMESDLNGRFGVNYFKHDFDKTANHVGYALDGKLQTVDVLFDWYLREGSNFRLTGGVLYNGTRFGAKAKPDANGRLTLNGHVFAAKDIGTVDGRIDYPKAAPYIGIGWGNALTAAKGGHGGWSVNADLGVFYMGNPNVKLGNADCATAAIICKIVANDLAVESVHLRDAVDGLKVYPVLRASLAYGF